MISLQDVMFFWENHLKDKSTFYHDQLDCFYMKAVVPMLGLDDLNCTLTECRDFLNSVRIHLDMIQIA